MFKTILLLLTAIVVSISAYLFWIAQRALPPADGILALKELRHRAVVEFDEYGVPYIEASNDRDLLLAQGYVTASDRMFQMDMLRRSALGELSQVFGAGSLPHDRLMRTIGIGRISRQEVKHLSAEANAILEAYCSGINSYIASMHGKMPLEFVLLGYKPRLWEKSDTIAILKHRQYELDESWRLDDLKQRIFDKLGKKSGARLFGYGTAQSLTTTRDAPKGLQDKLLPHAFNVLDQGNNGVPLRPFWGSNAWAVSPAISDSKGALLACDKHSAFTFPPMWHLASLSSPTTHTAGATIPGVPGIILGRNNDMGWGSISLKADVQDLVLEQFSRQFPNKYKTTSGWQNAEELIEEIPVRFADLLNAKNIMEKVQLTKHGPVLVKNDRTAIALAWTGTDTRNSALETIWRLNHAKNWTEFTNALRNYNGPAAMFLYCDRSGNIGSHVAGNIPYKSKVSKMQETSGDVLSKGWTTVSDWISYVPFENLPYTYNPNESYCVASNQKSDAYETTGNSYPSNRVRGTLYTYKKSAQKIGLPDMALLQGDQHAALASLLRKQLHQSINRVELIDRYQLAALDLFDRWDGVLSKDSPCASIYEMLLRVITRRVLLPKLGPELTAQYLERWPEVSEFIEHILLERPADWLPPEERTYDTFLLTSFTEALRNLRHAFRNDDPTKWPWQHLHKITFSSTAYNTTINSIVSFIFNMRPMPAGGDQDCINACNVIPSKHVTEFNSDSGPTVRLLLDMSDSNKLYAVIPLGNSGHLLSPHRTDQLRPWLNLEPHVIAFSQEQLDKQRQHKLILDPHLAENSPQPK